MTYILPPNLSVCDAGGQRVFLDVAADRYFALSPAIDATFRRLVDAAEPEPGDAGRLEGLVARGILCSAPGDARPGYCKAPRTPRSDRDSFPDSEPRRLMTLAAVAMLGRTIVDLRVRSLERVLASVTKAKRHTVATAVTGCAARHAVAFSHVDRLVSSLDRCLPRSIALARAMIADGIVPDLVLGVKLRPFEAHCWIQHDDLLVSDHLGAIAPFTPILVL
ncbi:lasso peptide biosynthesis B2 protein [Sphingomonas paeninsulae]|nr:lasso peptide biosynthesis B2 protein [Sphingomonas paeninsulae]